MFLTLIKNWPRTGGILFNPKHRGNPEDNVYWVFLIDPDGNMIELQD
ncbi:MAG: hypothetical protein GX167_07605 [Firmicutes bacterium]|nr:hypothetical protein [Bacillota bacterium]